MSPAVRTHWVKPKSNPIGIPIAEAVLVDSLSHSLRQSLRLSRGERVVLIKELSAQYGIADLIAVVLQKQSAPSRDHSWEIPSSPHTARVLALVQAATAPLSSEALAERAGLHIDSTRKILRRLATGGFVRKSREGYRPSASSHPKVISIVGIEAKTNDWRSGLLQARRYLLFADTAFLAMPRPIANRLRTRREVFERAGIGLGHVQARGV